jgi:hypothetical protein
MPGVTDLGHPETSTVVLQKEENAGIHENTGFIYIHT